MSRQVASLGVSMIAAFASSLCALTITAWSNHSAFAAAACAAAPKGTAPAGSHWYYRTDRTAQRKCWYLAAEGHKGRGAARFAEPESEPQARTPAAPGMKGVVARLTEPFEVNVDVPPPSAEQNSARASGNAAADAAPVPASEPAAVASDKDQIKDQAADQPTVVSDGPARIKDAHDATALVEAQAPVQQPAQPVVATSNAATLGAEMRMLPLAVGVFIAATLLAGAILYGARRRQDTIVRIVDLNAKVPRMPNVNDPGVPFSLADVPPDDEHGGTDSARRLPPPWRRQAA